jgi:hypothetical protein
MKRDRSMQSLPPASERIEVGDILLTLLFFQKGQGSTPRCYVLKKEKIIPLLAHSHATEGRMLGSIDYVGRSVRQLLDQNFDRELVVDVASLLNCYLDSFKAEEHMRKMMAIVEHTDHDIASQYIRPVQSQLSRVT